MSKKILLICLIVAVVFVITGCGPKKETSSNSNNESNNSYVENNTNTENTNEIVEEPIIESTPETKMADVWMSLPENVNLYWRVDEKNANNSSVTEEYKRGNNVMSASESRKYGFRPTDEANWLDNHYYYYEYQGNYKWKSYSHTAYDGWHDYYFNGNFPSSPQAFSMGRPYNILDNYSDEHVTINIEGLGDVDTVTGKITEYNGTEYTFYYAKSLGINVKIENVVQAWYLTKIDTNVSSSFPHALPNINEINANNQTEEEYYFDDDEIVEFDDEPNGPLPDDLIVTTVDESAKGLVFAYYQKKDKQLTFGDVLTDYTTDYTTIRRGNGMQRGAFLGFILDENDRIQRAFACGIYKGTLFALEGTTDGSTYASNKGIINRVFAGESIEDKGYRYTIFAETHAETFSNGKVSTFYEAGAQVDAYGKIYCD